MCDASLIFNVNFRGHSLSLTPRQARANLSVKAGAFSIGAFAASNRGKLEDFYEVEHKVGSFGARIQLACPTVVWATTTAVERNCRSSGKGPMDQCRSACTRSESEKPAVMQAATIDAIFFCGPVFLDGRRGYGAVEGGQDHQQEVCQRSKTALGLSLPMHVQRVSDEGLKHV